MKTRTLFAAILGLLFISGLSMSQEPASKEPNWEEPILIEASPEPLEEESISQGTYAMETSGRRRSSRARSSSDGMVMKIFKLKYYQVEDLEHLIEDIFSINGDRIHADRGSNQLILQTTSDQMTDIEGLIEKLDVPDSQLAVSQDVQNLVYRIYMFETSSGNEGMKSFSMILRTKTHVSSEELLGVAADKDLQISEFLQSNDFDEPQVEILIQGKAASNESLKRVVEKFPESHILELKWDDDETFTSNIAAAQYTQLPEQMQKHIRKFLGDDIRTVGYWFGNSSVPGEIEAPIGPWTLNLRLDTESDRELELRVDVEVPERNYDFERRLGRERSDEILSNTIRAKVGKPIIIGYNRESYGARKMGAMVIVPEADAIQVKED